MEKNKIVIVIVVVVVFALGIVFYSSKLNHKTVPPVKSVEKVKTEDKNVEVQPVSEKVELHKSFPTDYILGNPNSKIQMLEYSSMTCPHCANLHLNIFPEIKKKYIDTGKIGYTYRHYPLDKIAFSAAKLSHCAGKDKFYKFVDVLFKMQREWAYSENPIENLKRIAKLGGMSETSFDACMKNKELEKQLLFDMKERAIAKYKVNATPCVFINDKKIPDDRSVEVISKIIDDLLKQD